jgi:hypothetical protein
MCKQFTTKSQKLRLLQMIFLQIWLHYYKHPSEDVIFNLVVPLGLLDLVDQAPPSDLEGPAMSSHVKLLE